MTLGAVEPADAETAEQLLGVEDRRIEALIAGDLETLDGLFDESLVHIHAPGLVQNKAQLLEHVGVHRAYLGIIRGPLQVRIIGDVAIMTGPITNRLRTADGGERIMEGVVTQVLRRQDDHSWRFVNFQLTPVTEQAWAALPSQQSAEERA